MKTPKEITIDYLESIVQEKKDVVKKYAEFETEKCFSVDWESFTQMLQEIKQLENAIKIVKESEGE